MSTHRSNVRPMLLGFILILAVVGVGLLILVISETPVTKPQEIVVATGSWPPYIVKNSDSQADAREHGPLAAFATEMFRLAGYKIKKIKFCDWEAALDEVESGGDGATVAAFPYAYEADIPGSKTETKAGETRERGKGECRRSDGEKGKRTDRFWFTESFFPFAHVLYFNRNKIEVADLVRWAESPNPEKTYRLGRVSGYALWPKIVHSVKSISEPYDSIEKAFQALRDDKIDLLPESPHVGSMILQAMDPEGKEFGRYWSPEGVMAGSALTLHVLTARNRTGLQLRNQLNAAIATLARQGRLAALRSNFFDKDDPRRKRTPGRIRLMTVAREHCGRDEEPCRRFVLAQGTSAVVLIWPRFLQESSSTESLPDDAGSQEFLVKIKSGPHANELVYVPVSALELNAQGE